MISSKGGKCKMIKENFGLSQTSVATRIGHIKRDLLLVSRIYALKSAKILRTILEP